MLRIQFPFIYTVNISFDEKEFEENSFIEKFFVEVETAFCQDKLFFGLPFTLERVVKVVESKDGKGTGEIQVIAKLKINNIDKKTFSEIMSKLLTSKNPDIAPGETFHIGFNIQAKEGRKKIVQFATDFDANFFRSMALALPLFTKTFFDALKQSEYFVYDSSIREEVVTCFASLKAAENLKAHPSNVLWYDAVFHKCKSSLTSLYFCNGTDLSYRRDFLNLSYLMHRIRSSKLKINGQSIQLSYEDFLSPTNPEAQNYTAQHLVEQLHMSKVLKDSPTYPKNVLYVGAAYGKNPTIIQSAYPNMQIYAVEPIYHLVQNYEGDKNRVFLMFVEELCHYPEFVGFFDYIIIPNIHLTGNQTVFWNAIDTLLNDDGQVFVGHFYGDPPVTSSPKSFYQEMQERFVQVAMVPLPRTVEFQGPQVKVLDPSQLAFQAQGGLDAIRAHFCLTLSKALAVYFPDFEIEDLRKFFQSIEFNELVSLPNQLMNFNVYVNNMTCCISKPLKADFKETAESLITYAVQPFKQIFYSGTKGKPVKNLEVTEPEKTGKPEEREVKHIKDNANVESQSSFSAYITELSFKEYERRRNEGPFDDFRRTHNEKALATFRQEKLKLQQVKSSSKFGLERLELKAVAPSKVAAQPEVTAQSDVATQLIFTPQAQQHPTSLKNSRCERGLFFAYDAVCLLKDVITYPIKFAISKSKNGS